MSVLNVLIFDLSPLTSLTAREVVEDMTETQMQNLSDDDLKEIHEADFARLVSALEQHRKTTNENTSCEIRRELVYDLVWVLERRPDGTLQGRSIIPL